MAIPLLLLAADAGSAAGIASGPFGPLAVAEVRSGLLSEALPAAPFGVLHSGGRVGDDDRGSRRGVALAPGPCAFGRGEFFEMPLSVVVRAERFTPIGQALAGFGLVRQRHVAHRTPRLVAPLPRSLLGRSSSSSLQGGNESSAIH